MGETCDFGGCAWTYGLYTMLPVLDSIEEAGQPRSTKAPFGQHILSHTAAGNTLVCTAAPVSSQAISLPFQSTKALFSLAVLGFHRQRNRKTHPPRAKPLQLQAAPTGSYGICHLFASTSTFSPYTTEFSNQCRTASPLHLITSHHERLLLCTQGLR